MNSRNSQRERIPRLSAISGISLLFLLAASLSVPGLAQNEAKVSDRSQKTAALQESKSEPSRKPVLEPGQFFGLASFGYASAKAAPEVMEKLFCYCGCDLTDNHNSLLDCFTSVHGVDCHICQEEAVLANKLHKDGVSITEIQRTIDQKYSNQYPFEQDTPTYKKYKSVRLYLKDKEGSNVKFGTQVAGPEAPDEKPESANPKLKPGKEPGKCCSAGAHDKESSGEKTGKNK